MFQHYLTTFLRNTIRFKAYSFINIFGLTVGITTALLIGLWAIDEVTFDNHYRDNDQIFEVMINRRYSDGKVETSYSTQGLLANELSQNYPEVELAARADWPTELLLRTESVSLMQTTVWADPELIDLFSFNVLEGTAPQRGSASFIVLTKSAAERYFPGTSAIGKSMRLNEKYELMVTTVIEDHPGSSYFQFDALAPFKILLKEQPWAESWDSEESQTFVKLKTATDAPSLNEKIKGIVKKNCEQCNTEPFLYKFGDLHLYGNFVNGVADGGKIMYVQVISIVGVLIILIACINFMNLATARSTTRGREIGVRKAVGARRISLALQFIGESSLIALFSALLSVAAAEILLPFFNEVTGKNITLDITPLFVGVMILFGLIVGVIAGSYPSLYLASLKAVQALKGQNTLTGSGLRKSLVVLQFALAAVMMICSAVVYRQLDYIETVNLGFDRANVIGFRLRDGVSSNKEAFKNEALTNPAISSLTFAGNDPFSLSAYNTFISWPGKPAGDVTKFKIVTTDKDFVSTMKMTVVEGRDFVDTQTDSMSYLVNEKAVEAMGLTDPIGTPVVVNDGPAGHIVGVIKDWNNQDLHQGIDPVIILCYPQISWTAFAKVEAGGTTEALKTLESLQKKFDPAYPFSSYFLSDRFAEEYQSEQTMQKLSITFTLISIAISCLGLFGLASFMVERRTKELGVRKVMGASVAQITLMLCNDFTKLVFVSLAIASPVSWIAAQKFLEGYTFHTNLSAFVFIIAGAILLTVAIITVGYHAIRAAATNPVDSLRNE